MRNFPFNSIPLICYLRENSNMLEYRLSIQVSHDQFRLRGSRATSATRFPTVNEYHRQILNYNKKKDLITRPKAMSIDLSVRTVLTFLLKFEYIPQDRHNPFCLLHIFIKQNETEWA